MPPNQMICLFFQSNYINCLIYISRINFLTESNWKFELLEGKAMYEDSSLEC